MVDFIELVLEVIRRLGFDEINDSILFFIVIFYLFYRLGKNKAQLIEWLTYKRRYYNRLKEIYGEEEAIRDKIRTYIPTKFQTNNPEQSSLNSKPGIEAQEDLFNTLLKEFQDDKKKYFYVLGGSGIGKTSFMINFYFKYKISSRIKGKKNIEIISLNKNFHRNLQSIKDRILEESNTKGKLRKYGVADTILLVDAFDENDTFLDYFEKLSPEERDRKIHEDFFEHVEQFYRVVVTSRTQLFKSKEDEPYKVLTRNPLTKVTYTLYTLYISQFQEEDIKQFIRKKYPRRLKYLFSRYNRRGSQYAEDLFKRVSHERHKRQTDVFFRPMLLAQIDNFFKKTLESKENPKDGPEQECKGLDDFNLYDFSLIGLLIDFWLNRELLSAAEEETMRELSKVIAEDIYQERYKAYIESQDPKDLYTKDYERLAQEYDISQIKVQTRSLLNRGDEGKYKFAHQVFFEYLLVYMLERDVNQKLVDSFDYEFVGLPWAKFFFFEIRFNKFLNNKSIRPLRAEFDALDVRTRYIIKENIYNQVQDRDMRSKDLLSDIQFTTELSIRSADK